jgi:ergothioneine biosynthesis protein EgtB
MAYLPGRTAADAFAAVADRDCLRAHFHAVRRTTEALCAPLAIEDHIVQSMPEASPVKWHLAHTTWFFETFVLRPQLPDYSLFHPEYTYLFNSYYDAVGARFPRGQRGLLTRPTVAEVADYRAYVDEHMDCALAAAPGTIGATALLGLHHEQQHQELILTDLKHAWGANPLGPVYRPRLPTRGSAPAHRWLTLPEGTVWLGHTGTEFAFDNESPRHRVFVHTCQLASRLTTCGEYLEFMADGGYDRPELWLSDGWAARQVQCWTAPLYWDYTDGHWWLFTLAGRRAIEAHEPVCHVSYYEADAFARWAGARLPTEAEWETAAATVARAGHYLEAGHFHPAATPAENDAGPLLQMFGDAWQWTASPYVGYPGYRPSLGVIGENNGKKLEANLPKDHIDVNIALSEYNGKFMINQMVLRGASCCTPRSHARRTYRNFFPPDARWQFSGIRLAKDDGPAASADPPLA